MLRANLFRTLLIVSITLSIDITIIIGSIVALIASRAEIIRILTLIEDPGTSKDKVSTISTKINTLYLEKSDINRRNIR